MKAELSAKLAMQRTVRSTTDAHPTAYAASDIFSDTYAEYVDNLEEIVEQQGDAAGNTEGETQSKANRRANITKDALKLSAALQLHGDDSGNERLAKDGQVSKSTLENASEDAFVGKVVKLVSLAEANATGLAALGITAAFVASISTRVATFTTTSGDGEHIESERQRAAKRIEELLAENDRLLERRMDPAVRLLADDQPDFADEYFFSREIEDPSFNTRAATVSVAAIVAGAPQPVEGATALIEPGGLQKTTGPAGKFFIKTLAAGTYTLSLSRPGYLPVSQEFAVTDGEMTTVNVVMTVDTGGSGD